MRIRGYMCVGALVGVHVMSKADVVRVYAYMAGQVAHLFDRVPALADRLVGDYVGYCINGAVGLPAGTKKADRKIAAFLHDRYRWVNLATHNDRPHFIFAHAARELFPADGGADGAEAEALEAGADEVSENGEGDASA